jgi:hypothetical protein
MTEEEATALGKRLSACKHFRPMPGLKDMQGRTWDDSLLWRWNPGVDVPDLRQPASMGILLACVREAWGLPLLGVAFDYDAEEWIVRSWNATILWQGRGNTEAEAGVAALEAAPR